MIQKKKYFENIVDIATNKKIFGLWIYLMSDCIFFATMFSVYAVMSNCLIIDFHFFNLKIVFFETLILLLSSFTYGMLVINVKYNKLLFVYIFLIITFLLGSIFIGMELYEFYNLINSGFFPQKNGFLSSFFTLISIHGIHIVIGLLWMIGIFFQIIICHLNNIIYIRILCLGLFWHFLDIIWICVFTVVYLIGSIR